LNDANCNTCNISDNDISIDDKNVNCTNVNNVLNNHNILHICSINTNGLQQSEKNTKINRMVKTTAMLMTLSM
jgi:hypothetical protein